MTGRIPAAPARIGSLCTGYGGLDMAVMDVLDATTAWHCQYDPDDRHQYAAHILAHRWPEVPNHGDITAIDWSQVEPVDVLTAGFPCQDLSYAGRGAGIQEGTRSGLWYSVADAIRALRPRLVFLENVRAIVNRRPGLDVVLASLADLGFDAEWLCLRASDVGAAHERERWFCLAWPAADPADLGHERGGPARRRGDGPADCGVFAPNAHSVCPGHDSELSAGRDAVQQRLRDDPARRRPDPPADADRRGQHGRSCDTQRGPVDGASAARPGEGCLDWGAYAPAIARWEATFGHPVPWPVEPGRGGRPRLSPYFSEWLMGVPVGHVTDVPAPPRMRPAGLRNARLKALGNGVVRQQAAHALRILLDQAHQEVPV